ncbi:MAG: hypothetical protein ACLFTE_11705 [Salinivenus sp.]
MKTPHRVLAGAIVLLLAAGPVSSARPATAAPLVGAPTVTTPSLSLIDYLRTELRAKDDARRQNALTDIMALASCSASCTVSFRSFPGHTVRIENETGMGSVVDLTALLRDVERVYRRDRSDEVRLQALDALIGIGNEPTLERLINSPASSSSHVAKHTQRKLVGFYLDRYPELNDRAFQRGTFSLDDIETVRLQRKRMERRADRKG